MLAMLSTLAVLFLATVTDAKERDNFANWFTSELQEVSGLKLDVQGTLPSCLTGIFVQPGPALFSMGDRSVNHALDGFSKINRMQFNAAENSITFSTHFLPSSFYNTSKKDGTIGHGMLLEQTTPPRAPPSGILDALSANDNNYIKAIKVGDMELIASDTTVVSVMEDGFSRFQYSLAPDSTISVKTHWEDNIEPLGNICVMAAFAHGYHDVEAGEFISIMSCIPLMPTEPASHLIFKISPSNLRKRELIAKLHLPGGRPSSYMHTFAVTENFIVIIAAPIYVEMSQLLLGKGLAGGGMRFETTDQTLFQVVDRKSGELVKELWSSNFIANHVFNAFEDEQGKIVIDLSYNTVFSHGFFQRFTLETIISSPLRDLSSPMTLMRFQLDLTASTVDFDYTIPDEPTCDIDLPKINPAKAGQPYCMVWGVQFGSDVVEKGFASFALVKRNICTGEKITSWIANHFPAEHEFIPFHPDGSGDEDEGVLVGIMFDSLADTSYVQVLDAKTLEKVAEAPLGIRVPFPVHSSFFPSTGANAVVV